MMLIGMGLFRLGVLNPCSDRHGSIWRCSWPLRHRSHVNYHLETRWILEHRFSALSFAQSNISYDLGRLAMTIGHLGALLLIVWWNILP
jgi:uncharacterized protein